MNKSILITGGCGFIGSHLVEEIFKNTNHKITVIDDLSSGKKENCIINDDRVVYIYKKIIDCSFLNFDCIYHLSAKNVNARTSTLNDLTEDIINLNHLLSFLNKNTKFFFTSSCAVYGEAESAKENNKLNPNTIYGLSKAIQEEIISHYVSNFVIIRPSVVFGERQNSSGETGIITIIKNSIKYKTKFKLFNDGETYRDYIYVKDVVDAIIKLENNSGIFNVGSNNKIKTKNIVNSFNKNYVDGGKIKEPKTITIDNNYLKSTIKWEPTLNVLDYLNGILK